MTDVMYTVRVSQNDSEVLWVLIGKYFKLTGAILLG